MGITYKYFSVFTSLWCTSFIFLFAFLFSDLMLSTQVENLLTSFQSFCTVDFTFPSSCLWNLPSIRSLSMEWKRHWRSKFNKLDHLSTLDKYFCYLLLDVFISLSKRVIVHSLYSSRFAAKFTTFVIRCHLFILSSFLIKFVIHSSIYFYIWKLLSDFVYNLVFIIFHVAKKALSNFPTIST